jgi:glutaconate CoA-transferase subunit A
MEDKVTDIRRAISTIAPGSTVAIGGSLLRRQPNALVREMVRQGIGDLTVQAFASSTATDLLAGAGLLRRFEGVYVGLFWAGLARNFRRAVEAGDVSVGDFPESAMIARFRAAAAGVGFAPLKSMLGTDMARHNPQQVREMVCPFTGQPYHALAAASPDVALIHGYAADRFGNVQWPVVRDSDDIDQLIARAAKRVIVSVERFIPHAEVRRRPTQTYIPHVWVGAVVEAPLGAHPGACDSLYDEDVEHLEAYLEASKTPAGFADYLRRFVHRAGDADGYLEAIGGETTRKRLQVAAEGAP